MSASLILPCAQVPSYISHTPLKSAGCDRTPKVLNFSSFNPYNTCQNPSRDSNIVSNAVPDSMNNLTNAQSHSSVITDNGNLHNQSPVINAFQSISPSDPPTVLISRSPNLSIASPANSSKKFDHALDMNHTPSSLIMPNIIKVMHPNQRGASSSSQMIHLPAKIKKEANSYKGLWGGFSSKSLSSFIGNNPTESDYGMDSASPQPLIHKRHTVIALSGNSRGPTSNPHTKLVREKKTKLNFLRNLSSSKSAIFLSNQIAAEDIRKSPSMHISQRAPKLSANHWSDLEGGDYVEIYPRKLNSTIGGCSRCESTSSISTLKSFSFGYDSLFCKLCLTEVPVNKIYQLQQCLCRFCTNCMQMYITLKIKEGESVIECPDSNCDCSGEISLEEIEMLVGRDLLTLHLHFRRNREIDLNPFKTWCPTPGCETAITLRLSKLDAHPQCSSCPSCNATFCGTCCHRWHPDKPCHPIDLNEFSKLPVSDIIKRCPRCKVPIERDAGCAQMQCKKCKHVFCWYCLSSLEDDFLLRHYDSGPCKNKLGHSRASILWHRAQVVIIFAGFGLLLVVASPVLLFIGPCLLCHTCRGKSKYDFDDDSKSVI